ncbi:hypothetical protein PIB30_060654 [Stylosanthes scabra]|uniref:Uncharacterized protein n=1 Tax=Stylosanthes scabra TaxID=79078 RepID=A0ABU6UNM1_9FABA|nr:hypothetical protein [Stylosanthes scabra]
MSNWTWEQQKKSRGKTTCSKLHSTDFKDRQEVEFFKGQPVGPTRRLVSDLSQVLGTIVRNPGFVTLLNTSWCGVPSKLKEDMWVNINKKFILPFGSKEWVMKKLCEAWKNTRVK